MGEDIQIQELAAKLPSEHVSFEQFNQNAEQPVEEQFQADRSALKTLAKFTGQGGGISLSFERKLLSVLLRIWIQWEFIQEIVLQ